MRERRSSPRVPIRVQLEGRKNGDVFSGISINLSEGGVYIETSKQLNPGDQVFIRLILPSEEEITGTGSVVRREESGIDKFGYAVHWALSDEERHRIAALISNKKY